MARSVDEELKMLSVALREWLPTTARGRPPLPSFCILKAWLPGVELEYDVKETVLKDRNPRLLDEDISAAEIKSFNDRWIPELAREVRGEKVKTFLADYKALYDSEEKSNLEESERQGRVDIFTFCVLMVLMSTREGVHRGMLAAVLRNILNERGDAHWMRHFDGMARN